MFRHPILTFALVTQLAAAAAQAADADIATRLDTVDVRGLQPTSLPTQIPTTTEGITAPEIDERINATDAEDALKYFPSLLVRKRYIGDYDHAVLATRASGTGNSARSLVFADGILISNLLGNGATFTPRWGLVTPEEIERVDVLYGPFSAAYAGNSVGAVVDYVTRMPQSFEAHVKAGYYVQDYRLYATDERFDAWHTSASIGDRQGRFAWWLNLSRLDSESQPIGFANRLVSAGVPGGAGTPVDGAVAQLNPREQPWLLFGATSQTNTVQDHAKLKLAWDFADDVRASVVAAQWHNDVMRDSQSFIDDANGNPVYAGNIVVGGNRYTLAPTDISLQRADLVHRMIGATLKQASGGTFDYSLSASRYDYARDLVRSPTVARPAADAGGAGRIANGDGTGWDALWFAATWRPDAAHVVDAGVQRDAYRLRTRVSTTSDWIRGREEAPFSAFRGDTDLTSVYVQDTWRVAARWTATLGVRYEDWSAHDGALADATRSLRFARRDDSAVSPKVALAYAIADDWSLKASLGRSVRWPTVSELFQGSISADTIVNNDPNLKPERAWTAELSSVHEFDGGNLRATLFAERTRDALYSQTNVTVTPAVTNIQNVDRIATRGVELAAVAQNVGIDGFDLQGSVTFADSIVRENARFPASVGRWQPRVPRWRANLVGTWRAGPVWTYTLAARYSGKQYNTLDNVDPNGASFTGVSNFFVLDARARWALDERWSGAFGVDNLNNREYWNFHPYPQRTWSVELRYDYR